MEYVPRNDSNLITREYFDSLLLEMRHIDAVKPAAETELFGETFSMPIATAALSHLNDTCERGMAKMAEGSAFPEWEKGRSWPICAGQGRR